MDKIDSRSLPLDALNERRRRAVKMRLEGTSLKEAAALSRHNSLAPPAETGTPASRAVFGAPWGREMGV
jgi:hypothetical protein